MSLCSLIPCIGASKFIYDYFSDKQPVSGIYHEGNKWYVLKFVFMYALIRVRKFFAGTWGTSGYGNRSRNTIDEMERPQTLPSVDFSPMAVDAVYFSGIDSQRNFVVLSAARKHHNLTQSIALLRVNRFGTFEHPHMPDTNIKTLYDSEFRTEHLHISPQQAMKTWLLKYDGPMKFTPLEGESKMVNIALSLQWDALTPMFDLDTDQSMWCICDAVAREPWSRKKFDDMKAAHQTHYEQFGVMRGTVRCEELNMEETLDIRGLRDHSYGARRSWGDLVRYGLQYISLENGDFLAIGAVSFPKTVSRLTIGFYCAKDGVNEAITWSDFRLYNMGEDGNPPKYFTINARTPKRSLEIHGTVLCCPEFYMGVNHEAKIFERMCKYSVNGISGNGISEWMYNRERYSLSCKSSVEQLAKNGVVKTH